MGPLIMGMVLVVFVVLFLEQKAAERRTSTSRPESVPPSGNVAKYTVDTMMPHSEKTSMSAPNSGFNPANGLPMAGNSGLDIHGNPYGTTFFEVNPANGLPMMGNSGFDIHLNPYGMDFDD